MTVFPKAAVNTKWQDTITILPTSYGFTKPQTSHMIVGYVSEFMLRQKNL